MARPTKLTRAKHRKMRLQVMLRKAEEEVTALEAIESDDTIHVIKTKIDTLAAQVEEANRRQLEREMGRINQFDPCYDVERLLKALRHRFRVDSGF